MLNVTAQRGDILHLLRRIPQQQGAIAHRRIGGTGGITAVTQRHQRRRYRHRQCREHTAAHRWTGTEANAAVLHLEFGFVVEPTPAQRPRFQPIFFCAGGGANYRGVKLGMLTGFYTKSVFTGKEPRLLLHAVIVAVDLVFASTEVTTAAHRSPGKAAPGRNAGLFGIITLAILLTLQ